MKSDIEIAQEAKMKPIADIAASLGLADEDVIPYGRYKAKVNHRLIHKASKQGKLILVTAISPTPAGEGKTTTDYKGERVLQNDFSIELKQGSITNQRSSGRCWMFAALNTLPPSPSTTMPELWK